MSILGAGLVKILDSSSEAVAYEVIGTRAFQTAQIGLQWGVQQRFPLLPATPTHCDGTVVTAVSSDSNSDLVGLVPDFSDVTGLKGCHVTKLLCTDFRVDGETYFTIESTGQFNGVYHVLGGKISPIEGVGPNQLNINSLTEKVNSNDVSELIFALSATMEGDTTNFYIYKQLEGSNINITTIARGVSVGNELEFTDEVTLGRSIIKRIPFENSIKNIS